MCNYPSWKTIAACLKHVSLVPCFSAIQLLLCSLSCLAIYDLPASQTKDLVLIKPILIFLLLWMSCCFLRKLYSFLNKLSIIYFIILHYTVLSCCCLSYNLSPSHSTYLSLSHSTFWCICCFWISLIGPFCTISFSFHLSFIIRCSSHSTLSFIISFCHVPSVYPVLFLVHEIHLSLSVFHYSLLSSGSVLFCTPNFLVLSVGVRFTVDHFTAIR